MGIMDRWTKKQEKEQLSKDTDTVAPKKASAKKSVAKKESTESKAHAVIKGSAYRILVKPLVTEKAAVMASHNKYAFVVEKMASKNQISQAVKEKYGIDPVAIHVINVQGRRVRFGKSMGRRQDFKKAIITLPAGKSITVHEGV